MRIYWWRRFGDLALTDAWSSPILHQGLRRPCVTLIFLVLLIGSNMGWARPHPSSPLPLLPSLFSSSPPPGGVREDEKKGRGGGGGGRRCGPQNYAAAASRKCCCLSSTLVVFESAFLFVLLVSISERHQGSAAKGAGQWQSRAVVCLGVSTSHGQCGFTGSDALAILLLLMPGRPQFSTRALGVHVSP